MIGVLAAGASLAHRDAILVLDLHGCTGRGYRQSGCRGSHAGTYGPPGAGIGTPYDYADPLVRPLWGVPIGQPGQDLFASEWPVPSQRLLMAIVPDAAD